MDEEKLIILTNQKLAKFETFLYDWENIVVATRLVKLHHHGGTDHRIFFVSDLRVIVFKEKTFGAPEKMFDENLYNLSKLTYSENGQFGLYFGENTMSFQDKEALKICKIILFYYSCLHFNERNPIKIESSNNTLALTKFNALPPNYHSRRYREFCKMNALVPQKSTTQALQEYDTKPSPSLRIGQTISLGETGTITADAICYSPILKNLSLDNYNTTNIMNFIPVIIERNSVINRIIFENYTDTVTESSARPKNPKSKLGEVDFKNCCFSVIKAVLNSLEKFEGRIISIDINACHLSAEEMREIFEILTRYPAFMKLKILRLDDGSAEKMNLDDLSIVLSRLRWIKMMSLSKLTQDTSAVLKSIFAQSSSLVNIGITSGRFLEPLDPNVTIPSNIYLIDINRNQVSSRAMESLGHAIFNHPRRTALTLYAADLASTEAFSEILRKFLVSDPAPVLAEFKWTGNEIVPEDVDLLLNFMRTQTMLSYLSIGQCFDKSPSESFRKLAAFVKDSGLRGLEIIGTNGRAYSKAVIYLLRAITGVETLQYLTIDRTEIGDDGVEALRELVMNNKNLVSLSCDGLKVSSLNILKEFYGELYASPTLTNINVPRYDFARFQANPMTQIPGVRTKKAAINAQARLQQYEKMAALVADENEAPMDLLTIMKDTGVSENPGSSPLISLLDAMDLISARAVAGDSMPAEGDSLGTPDCILASTLPLLQTSIVAALSIRTRTLAKTPPSFLASIYESLTSQQISLEQFQTVSPDQYASVLGTSAAPRFNSVLLSSVMVPTPQ